MPVGLPLAWHLKTAMILAGQLPDSPDDARIVLRALNELFEGYLSQAVRTVAEGSNVLPFTLG